MEKPTTRRALVGTLGGSIVGSTLGTAAAQSWSIDPLENSFVESKVVEGNNGMYVSSALNYKDSQLQERPDEDEYWAHNFEIATVGKSWVPDKGDVYNIISQEFSAEAHGNAIFNLAPNNDDWVGAAAWPNPPGGNWSQLTDETASIAAGNASDVVEISQTYQDLMNAYKTEGFETSGPGLGYQSEYKTITRTTCSHGLRFMVDQETTSDPPPCYPPPCLSPREKEESSVEKHIYGDAMTITTGVSEGDAWWETAAEFEIQLSSDQGASPSNRSATGISRDRLDGMSERELAELGILRAQSTTDLSTSTKSKLPEPQLNSLTETQKPTYLTTFDMGVNSRGVSRPKERSRSD